MWMCHYYGQTLDPLFSILPIFRLKDKWLVPCEDLKCLRNVPGTSAHLHTTDLIHLNWSHIFVIFLERKKKTSWTWLQKLTENAFNAETFFSKTAADVNTPVNRNLGCKNLQEPQNWQMDSNIHTLRLTAWPINGILKCICAQIATSSKQQHCISLMYILITTFFLSYIL